jgi:hypothetical protein
MLRACLLFLVLSLSVFAAEKKASKPAADLSWLPFRWKAAPVRYNDGVIVTKKAELNFVGDKVTWIDETQTIEWDNWKVGKTEPFSNVSLVGNTVSISFGLHAKVGLRITPSDKDDTITVDKVVILRSGMMDTQQTYIMQKQTKE